MVVSKWSPITERALPEEKSIPLWVHLKKVPLHMYSLEGLSFIASAVGTPVRLHPETRACSNFDVAKVFVNADLTKVPPTSICYSKSGTDFSVNFHYPWLPPRRSVCEKWGHLAARCVVNKDPAVITPPGLIQTQVGEPEVTPPSAVSAVVISDQPTGSASPMGKQLSLEVTDKRVCATVA
ncbi:PREDICTED: uncharacterized protein LOC104789369 [Camelina sativa]|uniref:Uncharacterized protein LOC104789369 n=1 Tax=Camelina sativa TaxID=90675 RepID=A0ABM0ZBQ6_CAMSA|nr:PREDICTED: uncharacterized protein LOC104789369 [Camelina sativa]